MTASSAPWPSRSLPELLRRSVGYNLIAAVPIGLAITFQVLLARTFGASLLTDAYLAAVLLMTFLSTMASALAETFTQYYHEIKARDAQDAIRFYQAVLNVSLAVGLGTAAAAMAFAAPIARVLAPGFEGARLANVFPPITLNTIMRPIFPRRPIVNILSDTLAMALL